MKSFLPERCRGANAVVVARDQHDSGSRLVQQFSSSSVLSGIAMDLLVSVIVFWFYMFTEANKLRMKNSWIYVVATMLVGLSFALPLFLYFRESKLESR